MEEWHIQQDTLSLVVVSLDGGSLCQRSYRRRKLQKNSGLSSSCLMRTKSHLALVVDRVSVDCGSLRSEDLPDHPRQLQTLAQAIHCERLEVKHMGPR